MSAPVEMTDADWDADVLGAEGPVLVDFWAPWCGPCKKLDPIVRELAERYEGRLTVATLDVDAHPRSAGRHDVLSLPTLILFKGGEQVERIAGSMKAQRLERVVAAHLDP